MNNKGQIQLFFVIIVIALLVVAGLSMYIFSGLSYDIVSQLNDSEVFTSNNSIDTANDISQSIIPVTDQILFWVFIAMMLGLILLGIYLDFSPVVIILGIIILLIGIFLASQGTNIIYDLRSDTDLSSGAGFTLSNVVFGPLFPIIILMIAVITLIIVYGRKKDAGYY